MDQVLSFTRLPHLPGVPRLTSPSNSFDTHWQRIWVLRKPGREGEPHSIQGDPDTHQLLLLLLLLIILSRLFLKYGPGFLALKNI